MPKNNLKKQLFAAIAMVAVSGLALGSSTYAWFVSNSEVTATTTAISAQSNSAYLVIDTAKTTTASTYDATIDNLLTAIGDDAKLYPTTWKNNFDADGLKAGDLIYQFESAYASAKDNSAINEPTRFAVGNVAEANDKDYALSHTFYVGTGTYDGEFSKLKIADMEVTDENAAGTGLKNAMRVLVEAYAPQSDGSYLAAPTSWVVASFNGGTLSIESRSENLASADENVVYLDQFGKAEGDVKLVLTEYYDGNDTNVYTTNLEQLKLCNTKLTFSATPVEYGK